MGTTWVLHTETKGTGAQMVPLESVTGRASSTEPVFVPRRVPGPAGTEEPQRLAPRRFKLVDVMTRETIVEDVPARQAIDALSDVRSMVDVNVYVWQDEHDRWRLLSFPEQRAMWELARA
jgi:hypothetical protein